MKIIFFGLGSIGQRHAKILLDNFSHKVFAYRSNNNCFRNKLGIKELYSWREVGEIEPDIAFITNPTFLHIKTALRCAPLGMHLFIEKPLSNSLKNVDLLQSICKKKKLTCYTAYSLRFHPVIKKIRELIANKKIYHIRITCSSNLADWRKPRDSKTTYSASIKQGGGVLLDLSHEFDYIQYLFGQINKIKENFGRVSNVTLDAEDFADLLITLENGINVNLHLDFLSLINERSIKVDFNNGYLVGDLIKNRIDYFYNNKKKSFKFDVCRDDYLKKQIKYFFDSIGNPKIMNSLQESSSLLGKILSLKNG